MPDEAGDLPRSPYPSKVRSVDPASGLPGSRVTSDGGLVLVHELDERLGFSDLIARHMTDSRAKNTQLPLADLLRQSIYSRMAGYEDVNDAERLAQDLTFR